MTLREKIEVMEAFERYEEWRTVNDPSWKWDVNKHRIKPKPKQVVVLETWLCKSSWDTLFIQEAEPSYFKSGGYNFNQKKKLSTREVEIDSH